MGETAVHVGSGESDGLFVVADLEELENGGGLTLAGQGVKDDTFDSADFLRVHGEADEQGDEDDKSLFHNIAILLFSNSESKSTAICKGSVPLLDERPVSFDEFPKDGP